MNVVLFLQLFSPAKQCSEENGTHEDDKMKSEISWGESKHTNGETNEQ